MAVPAKDLPVRYVGSNAGGDYYKVNASHNVKHFLTGVFCCLDDRSNACIHVAAARGYVEQYGAPDDAQAGRARAPAHGPDVADVFDVAEGAA